MLLQKWPTFPGIALQWVNVSELDALFLIRAMDFIQHSGNVIYKVKLNLPCGSGRPTFDSLLILPLNCIGS